MYFITLYLIKLKSKGDSILLINRAPENEQRINHIEQI